MYDQTHTFVRSQSIIIDISAFAVTQPHLSNHSRVFSRFESLRIAKFDAGTLLVISYSRRKRGQDRVVNLRNTDPAGNVPEATGEDERRSAPAANKQRL